MNTGAFVQLSFKKKLKVKSITVQGGLSIIQVQAPTQSSTGAAVTSTSTASSSSAVGPLRDAETPNSVAYNPLFTLPTSHLSLASCNGDVDVTKQAFAEIIDWQVLRN